MTNIPALRRRPTGFSDPSHYEEHITVVGFAFSPAHIDGGGYNRTAPSPVAIFIGADGHFASAPVGEIWALPERKEGDSDAG